MKTNLFEYRDYKEYLNDRLDDPDAGGGRGARAKLSRSIGVQTAFTAQVLRGSAHFSLEHAELINDFFGHTEEQGHFFLLLVQLRKAGTQKLKQRFSKQIESISDAQLLLKNRLKVAPILSAQNQVIYYSAWYYSAIHAMSSIPEFKTPEKIAQYLGMDPKLINEAIRFLVSAGLVVSDRNGLGVGTSRIHLGTDSPLVAKHHTNWRLEAIRAVERPSAENLHYSSIVSISDEDSKRIRELLVQAIEKAKSIIRSSPEERLQAFSIDFFRR